MSNLSFFDNKIGEYLEKFPEIEDFKIIYKDIPLNLNDGKYIKRPFIRFTIVKEITLEKMEELVKTGKFPYD